MLLGIVLCGMVQIGVCLYQLNITNTTTTAAQPHAIDDEQRTVVGITHCEVVGYKSIG